MPADYLQLICVDLLGASAIALDVTRTGNPNPVRQLVTHGEPVWDLGDHCESQLAVWHGPILHRQVAQGRVCQILPLSTFYVEIVRCVPVQRDDGSAPSPDVLTDSADELNRDAWSLLTDLYVWAADRGCDEIDFGPAETVGPLGGIGGWRVAITVSLNDSGP